MAVKIREHMTFKSGKFYFSCQYDKEKILPLIAEGRTRYNAVNSMPILPDLAAQLNKELMRRSILGTAAIEGNPLNEDEVEEVIEGGVVAAGDKARLEIANLESAYALLREPVDVQSVFLLSEAAIKDIHRTITLNIDYYHNSPGKYRNELVRVGDKSHGGVYTPPKTLADIKALMSVFIEWINSEEMLQESPLVRAAMAHYHLAKIHPFQDGNGRTARLVEALLLHHAGTRYVPPELSNYYCKNIDDYFSVFSSVQTGDPKDVTLFLEFYLAGFNASLDSIQKKMQFWVRCLTLRTHIYVTKKQKKITKRQQLLLLILLDTFVEFSLGDLFTKPIFSSLYNQVSESTARRDIRKLSGLGLLKRKGDAYRLNLKALG